MGCHFIFGFLSFLPACGFGFLSSYRCFSRVGRERQSSNNNATRDTDALRVKAALKTARHCGARSGTRRRHRDHICAAIVKSASFAGIGIADGMIPALSVARATLSPTAHTRVAPRHRRAVASTASGGLLNKRPFALIAQCRRIITVLSDIDFTPRCGPHGILPRREERLTRPRHGDFMKSLPNRAHAYPRWAIATFRSCS